MNLWLGFYQGIVKFRTLRTFFFFLFESFGVVVTFLFIAFVLMINYTVFVVFLCFNNLLISLSIILYLCFFGCGVITVLTAR